MMIETCQNGYELHVPTSGGKAGKGLNRTSALQVRLGNQIVHQVRFRTASPEARAEAVQKARDWVMAQSLKPAAPPAGEVGA